MAIRTVSNLGGNWTASTAWVEGSVPTASDDVVFTATSGNITVTSSGTVCRNLDFTNYVGTITFNQHIQMCGDLNLGTGGYTQAGINNPSYIGQPADYPYGIDWDCSVTKGGTGFATFYPNGVELSRRLAVGNGTYTLTGYAGLSGGFGCYNSVVNGYSISLKAPYAKISYGYANTGTTELIFKNTGTFLGNGTSPYGSSSGANYLGFEKITINAPGGTISCASTGSLNSVRLQNNTTSTLFKIITGSLDLMTTSTGVWIEGTVTLDLGTTEIYSLTERAGTFTLLGNLTITDLIIAGIATVNGYELLIKRNCTFNTWYCAQQGTTVLRFIGTGILHANQPQVGQHFGCAIIFDTTGTISGDGTQIRLNGASLTHVKGSVLNLQVRVIATTTAFDLGSEVIVENLFNSATAVLVRDLHVNNIDGGVLNNLNTYVYSSVYSTCSGTSTIILKGDNVKLNNVQVTNDMVIASKGIVELGEIINGVRQARIDGNCTYQYGKVIAENLQIIGTSKTLINFHRILFKNITTNQSGFAPIIMNEFFAGSSGTVTQVDCTGDGFTFAFTDSIEKFTKFVKLIDCRFSSVKQLKILTGDSGNSTSPNVRLGSNQMPSGLPKNLPSVTTQVGYKENFLLKDPSLS